LNGGASLTPLAAAGRVIGRLPVDGLAGLPELEAEGVSPILLTSGGTAILRALESTGASMAQLRAAAATGLLQELLASGDALAQLRGAGGAALRKVAADGNISVTRFSPSQVPAVAAGYYWDPAAGTGGGGAGFLIPEGNGKTASNMITPSAGAAPAFGTINTRAVATYTNAVPDSSARTAAVQARGWTGATMIAGWFSSPGGPGVVFGHWRTNNNICVSLGLTRIDVGANDGAAQRESQFAVAAGWFASPVYVEALFDPAPVATSRLQLWLNRVQITPSVAGSMGTSLRDTASFLSFSGAAGDASTFNISANFSHGVVVFTNGIPSTVERDRLFNHHRLAA
jgi:hypothetical protein